MKIQNNSFEQPVMIVIQTIPSIHGMQKYSLHHGGLPITLMKGSLN
jgi:hypothetical protein